MVRLLVAAILSVWLAFPAAGASMDATASTKRNIAQSCRRTESMPLSSSCRFCWTVPNSLQARSTASLEKTHRRL